MPTTKYPPQSPSTAFSDAFEPSGALLSSEGGIGPQGGCAERAPLGGEAPLDWIEEHLTFDTLPGQYRRASQGGRLLENWHVPHDWCPRPSGEKSYVLKVQPFEKGGYEAVCRSLDLDKIANAMEPRRRTGKREAPEELDPAHVALAVSRAKRRVRHLVRNMMATHLLTLTKAEGPNTRNWGPAQFDAWENGGRESWEKEHGAFWSPDDWAKAWDRTRRLLTRAMGHEFPYVAILEKHQKGNYHLHVAWCGRVNVQLVRRIWLAVIGNGRGCGNIDARHIKVPAGGDRSSRIARYISKYVSKHFEEDSRFNKKRYWASRQTLPECQRYVLSQTDSDEILQEIARFLGLDWMKFAVTRNGHMKLENTYIFPHEFGVWINYIPELHGVDPPF